MQDHLRLPRKRRRANVLMIVFAMIFVMITLVAGLHYRQATARAVLFQEDANLQARVAAEYEMARLAAPNATFQPLVQEVTGQLQHASGLDLPAGLAKHLFTEDGVPDLASGLPLPFDNQLKGRPGLSWNQVKPQTSSPSIRPDKSQYLGVVSSFFPYVAYAPQGTITCEDTFAWRNQLFDNPLFPPDKAHSGGSLKMAAQGDITLKSCAYGELYTRSGRVSVDSGRILAFRGTPPNLSATSGNYLATLNQQIGEARTALSQRAFDKTALFNEAEFGLDFVFKLLKGNANLSSLLSLRQAMKFPFLMIPGGNTLGLVTNIWLHVPYAPDGASTEQGISSTNSVYNDQIKARADKIQEIQAALEEVEKKIEQQGPLLELQLQKSQLQSQLQAEGEALKSLNDQMQAQLGNSMAASQSQSDAGPASRSQEGGLTKDGRMGWAYGPVFSKILSIFGNLLTGQFEDLAKDVSRQVRLVHFGRETYATDFQLGDGAVQMTATMNVPPGRALKLRSNLTIRGDLWLMRGSTLVVEGDLHVVSPLAAPSDDPRKPQGKIFLEEGANLVVTGNLRCQGGPKVGSILVGAPYKKLHPVMGALLVGGDIDIPYAVLPAFSMADLDSKVPALKAVHTAVFTVLPNLAKIDGPFHQRKPFFATYATTFQIWKIPGPWGVIIIPTPIPLPTPKNINNPIFRVASIIYTTQMNLAWGEYFLTHCDWWFMGDQVVPMWPKVDPTGVLEQMSNLPIPSLPGAAEIQTLLVDQAKKFVTEMVTQLVASVVPDLVTQQMGFPISLIADFVGKLIPLEEWIGKLLNMEALQGPLNAIQGVDSLVSTLESRLSNVESLIMMHETPGLLLYAGGRLQVASQAGSQPPPLTVGMLVAQGDVISNARMTVGCAISLNGNVRTRNLLYDPNVSRCSLYLPKAGPNATPTNIPWLDWALEFRYGQTFNSNEAIDLGPTFRHATLQGWKQ